MSCRKCGTCIQYTGPSYCVVDDMLWFRCPICGYTFSVKTEETKKSDALIAELEKEKKHGMDKV